MALRATVDAGAGGTIVTSVTGTAPINVSPTTGGAVVALTGTVPVLNGGTGVTIHPAFRAHAAISQSISASTFTKVTLGTEDFDTNNNFASNRFTPTVAGYYQINATIRASDTVSMTLIIASIYKNGAEYLRGAQLSNIAASSADSVSLSDLINFNGTTDYVELFGFITGTSPSFEATSAALASTFSGSFVTA